jgi:hypothetical protein
MIVIEFGGKKKKENGLQKVPKTLMLYPVSIN